MLDGPRLQTLHAGTDRLARSTSRCRAWRKSAKKVRGDQFPGTTTWQVVVDCKGVRGKYVQVTLPGSNRVFDVTDVQVNAHKPAIPAGKGVRYAILARSQTETQPEFVIAEDPEDPIFYSSCIIREPKVKFLETGNIPEPAAPRWKFNGRCLTCDSFEAAKAPFDQAKLSINKFAINKNCDDCDGRWNRESPVKGGTLVPTPAPSPTPTHTPTPGPTTPAQAPKCVRWCTSNKAQRDNTWDQLCAMKARCDNCTQCFQGPLSGSYPPTAAPTAEPQVPTEAPTSWRLKPRCKNWCKSKKGMRTTWAEKCKVTTRCGACAECSQYSNIQTSEHAHAVSGVEMLQAVTSGTDGALLSTDQA